MTPQIITLRHDQIGLITALVVAVVDMLRAFDDAGLSEDAAAVRETRARLQSLVGSIPMPLATTMPPPPPPPPGYWRTDPATATHHGCTSLEWMLSCHAAEKRHPTNPYPQSKDIELGKDAARHILPAYLTTNEEQKA